MKAKVGLMLVVAHFVWGLPLCCPLIHIKRDWLSGESTGHVASYDLKAVKLFSQRGKGEEMFCLFIHFCLAINLVLL